MFAVDARRQHACTQLSTRGPQKRKNGIRRLFYEIMKNENGSPASSRIRRCLSGSSAGPESYQLSPVRTKGKKESLYLVLYLSLKEAVPIVILPGINSINSYFFERQLLPGTW